MSSLGGKEEEGGRRRREGESGREGGGKQGKGVSVQRREERVGRGK